MLRPEIFKANDIRGIAVGPDPQWDLHGAAALGAAYVAVADLVGATFVMSRDMRTTGEQMSAAFAQAAAAAGANVIDIGLGSTDELWFASGHLDLPGVQFTASHNPAAYNGIKFCQSQALPVSPEFLTSIAELAMAYDREGLPTPVATPGTIEGRDLLDDYATYLLGLVDVSTIRELTVVVDAGNGMAGLTAPRVLGKTNVNVIGLFMEPDGTFPNHPPNPLEPQNLVDAQKAVTAHAADLALVFDGDADRCFVIDETGAVVEPSLVTAMIAAQQLQREPGAVIVVNTITSQAVAEVVSELDGTLEVSPVGHTYVKAKMAAHDAAFGGEHSAHYYFRDFWGADTGMLAALMVLALVGHSDRPLSELAAAFRRYHASGELNSTVSDPQATMRRVADQFADRAHADWSDGVTLRGPDWWVNLRPSNTEPLLRLNVEARSESMMRSLRDETLAAITEETA